MPLPVAKMAITAGLMAANMALTMTRKIEGPRLDDLKFTGGDYGAPLPMIWGTRRQEGQIFWAEDLKEVKRRRKTKGGKFNDYTYYGTWAVAVAGHEISAITRMWFDTHLVYDATGTGPVSPFDFGGAGTIGDFIAIYLGTDDQLPDPRMQATVEAEFGEGSCPAYRDTAYVCFKDIPLAKIGNRIPQVSVEVVSSSAAAYPYEVKTPTIDPPNGLDGFNFAWSPDKAYFLWSDGAEGFEMWDTAARAPMFKGVWGNAGYSSAIGMAVANDSTIFGIAVDSNPATTTYLVAFDPDGGAGSTLADLFDGGNNFAGSDLVICESVESDTEIVGVVPFSNYQGLAYYNKTAQTLFLDTGPIGWQPRSFFADLDGNVWAVGCVPSTTTLRFERIFGGYGGLPYSFTVTGMPSTQGAIGHAGGFHYRDGTVDHFVVLWNENHLVTIDLGTLAVTNTVAVSTAELTSINTYMETVIPGAPTFWIDTVEYRSADLSVARALTDSDLTTNWVAADTVRGTFYDPINHALVSTALFAGTLTWRYLDRVSGNGVTLGVIAADIAEMVGVEDYDFTALDQVVTGWSATQGAATNMLEPLLDVYDSDVRPHNFSLQGVKRHGVSDGTLLTERFVGDPRYTVTVRQGAELPRSANINFADINADQQPNNVLVTRPLDATGARGEMPIDLSTLALDADEARGLADRHFRRLWNERSEVSLGLTAQQLALEPGDVRTLDLDGETMAARLVRLTVSADDSLQTEWRYDHPSLAILTTDAGATFDGRNPSVIIVPLISKGFVLDIPLLEDSDNSANPVLYMAAAPYADGTWPGATIYEAVDGEYSEEAANVASSAPAAWGYAAGALPDANPWLWDRGSSVNVTLQVGTLTGCTEAAINADPTLNLCLLGGELLNFTTATLEMDGSYTLSGFKRGRRGTEWATGTHAERDVFLLLDTADDVEQGLSEVGTDLTFKAVTASRTEAGSFPIPVSFTGASLKPYAPAHLEAVKEANGDWTLTWVRRTRVGGAWTSGTSIPLSEAGEEYELDLGDGVASVTKAGLTSPTYTWTQAEQVTDTGSEVLAGDLDWSVAQVSDAVGAGFQAQATA